MAKDTKIEWADHTFNPWWGCVKVSPACDHCYAERLDARLRRGGEIHWGKGTSRYPASPKTWDDPFAWNKKAEKDGVRRRVFCGSMCDVMEDRPESIHADDAFLEIERLTLYSVIDQTPWLDWLLLTKRPQNFRRFLPPLWLDEPCPNVWLMTTVESSEYLWRAEELSKTPARIRGLSMEPLLGPVDISPVLRGIDWVIAGGESGPGARPSHPDWFRLLRDQCKAAGVAFHFKQWGEWVPATAEYGFPNSRMPEDPTNCKWIGWDGKTQGPSCTGLADPIMAIGKVGKAKAGRLLDGVEHNGVPE